MVIKSDNSDIQISKSNKNYKFIESLRTAPLLDRIAAFIIDYFIILVPVGTLLMAPLKKQLGIAALLGDSSTDYAIYINVCIIVFSLSLFYNFLFTYFFNATLGQIFMRLKVGSIIEGEKVSFFDAITRSLVFTVSLFLNFIFLLTLTHKAGRSLHGLVSDTYIYSTSKYRKAKLKSVLVSRASFVVGGIIVFFSLITGLQAVLSLNNESEFATAENMCEEVDEAMASWPEQSEVQPERLSIAMALYAIEGASKDCLQKEVNYVFDSGEGAGLAYLANAFVHADKAEISDAYLEKVCELDESSETCKMSKVIDGWATDDLDLVKHTLNEINSGSVYVDLWKSRFLISEGDYEDAFDVIARLPKVKSLSRYTSMNKAKLYWFKGKYEQAKIITDMILEKEITSDSDTIAGWLCFEELEKSCSELTSSSCQYVDRQARNGALAGLASIKSLECNDMLSSYHKYEWQPEVKALIDYKLNTEGEPGHNLLSFLNNNYADQRISYFAVTSFLQNSPNIDYNLFETIKRHTVDISMPFEKVKLSNLFLEYLVGKEYYDFAYNFGEKLINKDSTQSFKKNLVVSAFLSGDKEGAKEYLETLGIERDSSATTRGLASGSKFIEVLNLIESED